MTKDDDVAATLLSVNKWACSNNVALVVVAVADGRVVSVDHLDCPRLAPLDNAIASKVAAAMKAEVAAAMEAAFGAPIPVILIKGSKERSN